MTSIFINRNGEQTDWYFRYTVCKYLNTLSYSRNLLKNFNFPISTASETEHNHREYQEAGVVARCRGILACRSRTSCRTGCAEQRPT